MPAASRGAPRSRGVPALPGSSPVVESSRQQTKPSRMAKVSGRRLAAASRMVSAGGGGRQAARSAQLPAGILCQGRGREDWQLSALCSPPHIALGHRRDPRPTRAGGAGSGVEAGAQSGQQPSQEEEGGRPYLPGCQRPPALRRQLRAPSRVPLALAAPGEDGEFYFWKPPLLSL